MFGRMALFVAVAQCAAAVFVCAQERASADEILGFFPYGTYYEVEHIDSAAMGRGEAYALYMEYLANSPFARSEPVLPPSLAGEFESWTVAKLLRLKSKKSSDLNTITSDEKPNDVEEETEDEKEEPLAKLPEGTKMTVMENVGDRLSVYRYAALDLLVEEALKNGEMEATGHVMDERPIYSFRAPREDAGEEGKLYAYAMPTGELLTAERLRNLAAMVDSGMGRDLNILDEEDYAYMIGLLPDLGQMWEAACAATELKMISERMRRSGEDEERVKRMEEFAESVASLLVRTTIIGEKITEREYEVYDDENLAEERFKKGQNQQTSGGDGLPEEFTRHLSNLNAASKKELIDSMIVTTIVYDRKLLESAKASNEALLNLAGDGNSGKDTIVIIEQPEKKK